MPLEVRLATPADRAAVVEVSLSVWETDYVARDPQRFLADGEVLLALDGGRLLGFGKWEILPDGSAWIAALRTRPEARRQGVARRLTEEALARAAKAGARPARELIADDNEGSLTLARSLGFRDAARWGALWRAPSGAPGDAGALRPAAPGRFLPLVGSLVFYPDLFYKAVQLTPAVLLRLHAEGALLEGPAGEPVLRMRRHGEEGVVDYHHVFEPTPGVAAACAAGLDAGRPERAVVVVPWERHEDAATAFGALGFERSRWAWGIRILERGE